MRKTIFWSAWTILLALPIIYGRNLFLLHRSPALERPEQESSEVPRRSPLRPAAVT